MSESSVSAVSRLAWNSTVSEVTGIIDVVHPPKTGQGWGLQNGVLRDLNSAVTIEFMLSKHAYYLEGSAVGRTLRITAAKPDDLIFKEQRANPKVNHGRPFAKLEVAATARLEFVGETPSLFEPQRSVAPATKFTSGQPRPAPAQPVIPALHGTAAVRGELQRMMALYGLTRKEVSSSPFLKDQTPSEEVVWRLFAAGCLNGIHNQLDPKEVLLDLDPQAVEQMRPNYMALCKQFSGREPLLKLLLRGAQILEAGQELADISEERAGEALARTEVKEMAKAS